MKLPQMVSNVRKSKKYVVEFGGINKSSRFREGELADSQNLSSDLLPYISQRGKREQMGAFTSPTAIYAHNGIAVVNGTRFYYKGETDGTFSKKFDVTAGNKQIAQLGNYIIVFPDKIWYNCEDDEFGDMEGKITVPAQKSSSTDSNDKAWFWDIAHNYLKISDAGSNFGGGTYGEDFAKLYKAGDVISIVSGTAYDGNTAYKINAYNVVIKKMETKNVSKLTVTTAYFEDDTFFDSSENARELDGTTVLTLKKEIPALEYICCSGGRVWGCEGNKIFASAYQNPTTYTKYEGLSGDSYYIDASTPGEFTGCAAYTSHIVFFKEDSIHRIYGSRPSNFNMVVSGAPGVQKGSYNSVKMLNERLFYKGVDGVYMYSGGMPVLISEGLGAEVYTDAVAGIQGNKYYISMKNSRGEYEMFSYDILKGVFLKEDNTQFIDTAQKDGKMLFIDETGKLMAITGSQDTEGIEWSAELREFNETVNEKKGYSRITLRIELDKGAYIKAELALDSGRFEVVKTVSRQGKNIVNINIPPNRCDSFKLRLSGMGGCRVMNMVREFITGNEVW